MASEVKLRPGSSFLSCETVGHTECVGLSLLYVYSGFEDARPTDVTGLLQTPGDTEKLLKTPLQRRKNSIYPTSRMAHSGSSGTRAFAHPLCAQRNLRAAGYSWERSRMNMEPGASGLRGSPAQASPQWPFDP